ncbi:MAG: 2,3-diphosphoglycerate-dependent phosphoglycerate mutase [Actinomycetota bacterium]|nr:2,3-diphosphoglycerate-dependent phosphoglycerate mutase [Actinomycetota bacterium]
MPTLVMLRHGQSTWNAENLFTGWTDVDLTSRGEDEAREAGRLLAREDVAVDVVHTSLLRRAIRTANLALEELDRLWVPQPRHWRLNERHYGDLQGRNKPETATLYGDEQVQVWRRSYHIPPPALSEDDERHPRHDPRYATLPPDVLPVSECLADVVARMLPYWHDAVVPDLVGGRVVLLAAHGNSLRALVKHLDGVSEEEITGRNIPTGFPLVYELDRRMQPVSSRYLGDPAVIAAAIDEVAHQARRAP